MAAAVNPGYERHWYYLKGAVPFVALAEGLALLAGTLLRARPRTSLLIGAAMVCGTTGIVFALGFCAQPDRRSDDAENIASKRTIASYPDAELVETTTYRLHPDGDVFEEGFLNPAPGYGTDLTFLLPRSATQDTGVQHYRRAFGRHGWTVEESHDCSDWYRTSDGVCGRNLLARNEDGAFVCDVVVYRGADGRIRAVL